MYKDIHIYHINDLHSHFKNWPQTQRFMNEQKHFHEEKGEDVLFFDLGDFMDRSHPLTEATDGRANVNMMDSLPLNAVTIGNNEGIGNRKDVLNHLYDRADFPVVVANLFDEETGKRPDWAEPWLVLKTKNDMRVGIVGLTAPLYLSYLPNGWVPKESDDVLPKILAELRSRSDFIILLSHMGIREDERLAKRYPEFDVILGAHTHHVLPEGGMIKDTLLTGGGKWGQYIGHTVISHIKGQVKNKTTELIACTNLPQEKEDLNRVNQLRQKGNNLLAKQEIATIPFTFRTDWLFATDLVYLGLDAICDYACSEIGILNSGLFLEDLPAGTVTKETIHRILPHPMRLIVCRMTGKAFKALIWGMEEMRHNLLTRPVTGMGFRGKIFGELVYKGIEVNQEEALIYHQGLPIRDDQLIEFVTVDHYRYISFFPLIEEKGSIKLLTPYFLREIFSLYFNKQYPISENNEVKV